MAAKTLIDVEAVADRCGTTERHIRQLCTDRRIPHIKVGRALRFDPDAIEAWLKRNTRDEVAS